MYVTSDTSSSNYQTAYNSNCYGGMAYYSSSSCGSSGSSGCTTDYAQSEIKYVVDAWKNAQAPGATEARLIQYSEFENLGYVDGEITPSDIGLVSNENTPSWVYIICDYCSYWTNSTYNDSPSTVWNMDYTGKTGELRVTYFAGLVRPVIVLPKSAL